MSLELLLTSAGAIIGGLVTAVVYQNRRIEKLERALREQYVQRLADAQQSLLNSEQRQKEMVEMVSPISQAMQSMYGKLAAFKRKNK